MEDKKIENASEKEEKKKKRWLLLLLLLLLLLIFGSTGVWALFFSDWKNPAPDPPINESVTSDTASGNSDNGSDNPNITNDGNSNNSDTSSVTSDNADNKSDTSVVTSGTDTDPGNQEGGGSVSLTYAKDVSIDLTERKASLVFGNPSKSNREAVVRLVIQDTVILQSDSLAPGTQVTELSLMNGAEEKLTVGVCEGKFIVSFYDRPSGRWATLNAEIPVTVTVTE